MIANRLIRLPIIIVLAAALGGCSHSRRREYVASRPVAVAEPSADADRAWEAIQETLRRNRFQLDRVDRTAGVITTMPETSQHYFEFWRRDVHTASDWFEATLNPMRRWVEVTLTRGEEQKWQAISVIVHKERLSSPDRQFNSTGAAYQFFGDGLPSTTGVTRLTVEQDRWLDCGRDPATEDFLLRAILKRADLNEAPASQTPPLTEEETPPPTTPPPP